MIDVDAFEELEEFEKLVGAYNAIELQGERDSLVTVMARIRGHTDH